MDLRQVKRELLRSLEQLKTTRGYLNAGYPRYNTLFGRDSLIAAWQLLEIDPSIARATLQTLAHYQGKTPNSSSEEEPGKILHELAYAPQGREKEEPPRWSFPYYGSVDSTPLFIIVAGEYYKRTRDTTLLSQIWPNILAAYRWITDYGDRDGDGYVEYQTKNPHGLVHQGWKDGIQDHLDIQPPVALVEVQGYTYAAYRSTILIEQTLDRDQVSNDALARSEALKQQLNRDFWMNQERFFAMALDGEKLQKTAVTSNPGQLLFTGIVAQDKAAPLVARLFEADLWTPYGVRNHSSREPDFDAYSYHKGSIWPHDNWLIYHGLETLGFGRRANQIRDALLRAYQVLGKMPELYAVADDEIVDLDEVEGVWANAIQAWSIAGLLEMIWQASIL
jgi:glycogen debranching enzyme